MEEIKIKEMKKLIPIFDPQNKKCFTYYLRIFENALKEIKRTLWNWKMSTELVQFSWQKIKKKRQLVPPEHTLCPKPHGVQENLKKTLEKYELLRKGNWSEVFGDQAEETERSRSYEKENSYSDDDDLEKLQENTIEKSNKTPPLFYQFPSPPQLPSVD